VLHIKYAMDYYLEGSSSISYMLRKAIFLSICTVIFHIAFYINLKDDKININPKKNMDSHSHLAYSHCDITSNSSVHIP